MTITERFTLENFTPKPLKSGLYTPFDIVIKNGGTVCREYDVKVNEMQDMCHEHSKDCRIAVLGKSLTTYMIGDNNVKFFCTMHEMDHVLRTRFTEQGYLVQENWHP